MTKFGARNQITGKVAEIKKGSLMCEVVVDLLGGSQMTSVMAIDSLDDLGIQVGDSVGVVVKAVNVLLVKQGASRPTSIACLLEAEGSLRMPEDGTRFPLPGSCGLHSLPSQVSGDLDCRIDPGRTVEFAVMAERAVLPGAGAELLDAMPLFLY